MHSGVEYPHTISLFPFLITPRYKFHRLPLMVFKQVAPWYFYCLLTFFNQVVHLKILLRHIVLLLYSLLHFNRQLLWEFNYLFKCKRAKNVVIAQLIINALLLALSHFVEAIIGTSWGNSWNQVRWVLVTDLRLGKQVSLR